MYIFLSRISWKTLSGTLDMRQCVIGHWSAVVYKTTSTYTSTDNHKRLLNTLHYRQKVCKK